ncbi:MAG: TetR/AcrR family transcriptional regulator [Lachnospiraceae bacterium]|nr:TetR/AcrR family transcriptional regulator [Lachnospiraceae bacterium]MDE6699237.1 TetR/AcrR family transcriptional regulator [Lachnospiraceae bacterium]
MSKLELNKKQKRDSLLESAFSLFTSKGINKTSISDIVEKSGVAKGTFYLYFKDKYDIRNMLIAHKASQLFRKADMELQKAGTMDIFDEIIFLTDNILNQFCENKSLLNFISKNLSWGIFKTSLINPSDDNEIDFYNIIYTRLLNREDYKFKDPEIMLFMIIELISSTCYSAILYSEPVSIDELKPYLFDSIRDIIKRHIC